MYKKTNNTQKRRKTNNYKKRTTNKKRDTPIKYNDKTVRNYEVVNTGNTIVSLIKFESNIFKHKFKITTKDRNIILNKLGLKILDKSETTRFSKYYNTNEQEMLCGIFNEVFDNIEEYVNRITSKILYHNQTIPYYYLLHLSYEAFENKMIILVQYLRHEAYGR